MVISGCNKNIRLYRNVVNPKPNYSQRHHSPFPYKNRCWEEQTAPCHLSVDFVANGVSGSFFNFSGSSFFVFWNSSHGFLGQTNSVLVDDIRNFSRSWCVFFEERICWFCVVPSSCFLRSERWKLEEKKGGPHSWCSFLRQHFSHDIWMCLPDGIQVGNSSKLKASQTKSWQVTHLLSRTSYLIYLMINGQRKNSNFPWFWQVGTYSLGSAQCHIQGQVIGAGLKIITEIGNKGLHIITSFDWVQISVFSCPPNSGHA